MRVLVCGSRKWTDQKAVYDVLHGLMVVANINEPEFVIIEGCAPGADSFACRFGYEMHKAGMDWPYLVSQMHFPADWACCAPECKPEHRRYRADGSSYCPTAGHRRNQRMIDEGQPDMAYAFTADLATSRGTNDMVRRARKANVPVHIIGQDQERKLP